MVNEVSGSAPNAECERGPITLCVPQFSPPRPSVTIVRPARCEIGFVAPPPVTATTRASCRPATMRYEASTPRCEIGFVTPPPVTATTRASCRPAAAVGTATTRGDQSRRSSRPPTAAASGTSTTRGDQRRRSSRPPAAAASGTSTTRGDQRRRSSRPPAAGGTSRGDQRRSISLPSPPRRPLLPLTGNGLTPCSLLFIKKLILNIFLLDNDDPSDHDSDPSISSDEEVNNYDELLDSLAKKWLLTQSTHQVSAAAANSFWEVSMNLIPKMLGVREKFNIKKKVPGFIHLRRKLNEDLCPPIHMKFVYLERSTNTIVEVNCSEDPGKRYPKSKYQKLYEEAHFKVNFL